MLPKRLVFCGGGTRCLVFLQALVELEKKGTLTNVKEYWGTSAGAIIATLFALTKSSKTVKKIMFEANYTNFRDIDLSNLFGIQTTWGLDDGKLIVKEFERVFDMIEPGAKSKCLADVKGLNIVVSDITLRETIVCNSKTFPNLPIIDAIRASMSLPIFFKPYIHKPSGHIWVDGAIRANFPWHLLPDDASRSESLGFAFEKSSMYKPPKSLMEYLHALHNFDEAKRFYELREQWSKHILFFPLPPYPSWFIRLKQEDFELIDTLSMEGLTNWYAKTRATSTVSSTTEQTLSTSVSQYNQILYSPPNPIVERSETHEPSREPLTGSSLHQSFYKLPPSRRWSV